MKLAGVEKYGDPLSQCAAIAEILQGVDATDSEGAIVRARRMHSQAKYAVVARGGAEVSLLRACCFCKSRLTD